MMVSTSEILDNLYRLGRKVASTSQSRPRSKYTGEELRKIRSKHGVGRPPSINLERKNEKGNK